MIVRAEPLRRVVGRIFVVLGCAEEEAAGIAWRLVEANLAGHDSHGVVRVPRYAQWMADGTLRPGQRIRVVTETDVLAVVDGGHGFGQTIGPQAVQLGVEKTRRGGVSLIALRNAGHLGRIGDWAEMAADAGVASLHFVNVAGSTLVAPFGGVDRRMSTNPVAVGVPVAGSPHLVLDFATSVVAEGKALVAARDGTSLPARALVDGAGAPTGDPVALYGDSARDGRFNPREGPGALRAMGEHKGSGLAFMCEILAGALTGSGCAGPGARPIANGMVSVYIDAEVVDAEGGFVGLAEEYVAFFKSARPQAGVAEVLLPGSRNGAAGRRGWNRAFPSPRGPGKRSWTRGGGTASARTPSTRPWRRPEGSGDVRPRGLVDDAWLRLGGSRPLAGLNEVRVSVGAKENQWVRDSMTPELRKSGQGRGPARILSLPHPQEFAERQEQVVEGRGGRRLGEARAVPAQVVLPHPVAGPEVVSEGGFQRRVRPRRRVRVGAPLLHGQVGLEGLGLDPQTLGVPSRRAVATDRVEGQPVVVHPVGDGEAVEGVGVGVHRPVAGEPGEPVEEPHPLEVVAGLAVRARRPRRR